MQVEKKQVAFYGAYLKENHRPPSRGGNTKAWHQHVLTIDGEKYSFLALGQRKWVFKDDTMSFEWEWDKSNSYRNIISETVRVWNKDGEEIVRGHRGSKVWRTAITRAPVSRREWRD